MMTAMVKGAAACGLCLRRMLLSSAVFGPLLMSLPVRLCLPVPACS